MDKNIGYLEHNNEYFNSGQWRHLITSMQHRNRLAVGCSARSANLLHEEWLGLSDQPNQLQRYLENAVNKDQSVVGFAFIECALVPAVQHGDWEIFDCFSGLLDSDHGIVTPVERGDKTSIKRNSEFYLFAKSSPPFSPQKDHLFDSCEMSELISVTRTNSSCNTFINSYASLRHFLENCLNASNSTQHLLNRVFDEEHSAALSHRHLPFPMLLATILVFTIMILVGTFGSGLVIFVVLRKPSMRTRSNLFIMNLAISDLTLCLFTQPFTLYRLLIGHHPWALGSFMCKFSAMFQGTNIFVSTISITAIALDRFQ
ncbi:hypothetical protein T265_12603, partial [Opisthorchis viverrini]